MKKKLSLLVALLMVLTLIPFNAFALKASFGSVPTVQSDAKNVPVSATFEIGTNDVNRVSPGTITITLDNGLDSEFRDLTVSIVDNSDDAYPGKTHEMKTADFSKYRDAASFYIPEDWTNGVKTGDKIKVEGHVDLDFVSAGDQKWSIMMTGNDLALNYQSRAFAKVELDTNSFARRVNDVKVIGRGLAKPTALMEIRLKDTDHKDKWLALKLPSGGFAWNFDDTKVTNGTKYSVKNNDRILLVECDNMGSKKSIFVQPVIDVYKDAPVGDVEIEVSRGNREPDEKGDRPVLLSSIDDTDYVTVAEYKEYGLSLKTVKDVKEVFANGDKYKVLVELNTNDNNDLSMQYYDFKVEGAEVTVSGADSVDKIKYDAKDGESYDEFTFLGLRGRKVRFYLNITPDWDSAAGEIKLTVKNRYKEEAECVVLKVLPVATATAEVKDMLAGVREIPVTDVVITETKAGALRPGERFGISLEKMKFDYAKWEDKGTLEAEGIKIKDLKVDDNDQVIYFTVDSRSKKDAPAKIVLKDLRVVTSRALPLGTYKLVFGHVAGQSEFVASKDIKSNTHAEYADYYVKDGNKYGAFDEINKFAYFNAVNELGRVKKTTVFTLGSADYTVNGVAMKLDAPVFTQDNYTMLPVRAIADSLGVDVVWNQENKTATFIDGDKVVSITVNSKVLYKNGIAYPMATKSSVKAERMFISIASVGDAFGLNRGMDYVYDEAAKTVTIYPEAEKVVNK